VKRPVRILARTPRRQGSSDGGDALPDHSGSTHSLCVRDDVDRPDATRGSIGPRSPHPLWGRYIHVRSRWVAPMPALCPPTRNDRSLTSTHVPRRRTLKAGGPRAPRFVRHLVYSTTIHPGGRQFATSVTSARSACDPAVEPRLSLEPGAHVKRLSSTPARLHAAGNPNAGNLRRLVPRAAGRLRHPSESGTPFQVSRATRTTGHRMFHVKRRMRGHATARRAAVAPSPHALTALADPARGRPRAGGPPSRIDRPGVSAGACVGSTRPNVRPSAATRSVVDVSSRGIDESDAFGQTTACHGRRPAALAGSPMLRASGERGARP